MVAITLTMFRSGADGGITGENRGVAESAAEAYPRPEGVPELEPASLYEPQSLAQPEPQPESEPESASEPQAGEPGQPPKPEPKSEPKPAAKPKPRPEPKSRTTVATVRPRPQARERDGAPGHPAAVSPKSATSRGPSESGEGGRPSGGMRAGSAHAAAEGDYLAELLRAIAAKRFYPSQARRRGLDGVVIVYFVIRADGHIADIRITEGSGSDLLDNAAIETMKRLGNFKPIPKELGRDRWPLRVPIKFALR